MSEQFDLVEATISEIHNSMRSGDLTCRELVDRYRERIKKYDRGGPELNSVVTFNSNGIERAAELDETLNEDGFVGPLHGIPVLVKDQAMTAGLRTTFGSEAFDQYVPETDATIVSKLKQAGAVIVAKTNLPDWAAGDAGYSSVLGQTRNPYALDRDPGGSSAGTGAAVAANLGTVGVGEDTGGSIRVPSSNCNLFGLRVTTGLISRTGLSPLLTQQDTAGPMARTVEDLARLLDVLVGYDSADAYTSENSMIETESYVEQLDEGAIDNARIGVLRQAFGDESDPAFEPVNRLVESAIESIQAAGAEIIDPVAIDDLDHRLEETWLYGLASKSDIDSFLRNLRNPPIESFNELYESGAYYEGLPVIEDIADGPSDPRNSVEYWHRVDAQTQLRRQILSVFAEYDLDAIVFPDVKVAARRYEFLQNADEEERKLLTNTYIASQSSCPAISMPAGFTDDGIPAGIELLGKPYSEARLVSLAAGYESRTETRRPPSATPPL